MVASKAGSTAKKAARIAGQSVHGDSRLAVLTSPWGEIRVVSLASAPYLLGRLHLEDMSMATPFNKDAAVAALSTVLDPDLRKDLVTLNMIRDLAVDDAGVVSVRVMLTTPACPMKDKIRNDVVEALTSAGASKVDVIMDAEVRRTQNPGGGGPAKGGHGHAPKKTLDGVRNIVAVASGKGGVGKSTVATNLAVSLAKAGATVGLLDADIYGPSMPVMMGLRGAKPSLNEKEKIAPLERYGVKVISMGFMLKDEDAVVWRGPMLGKALEQFLFDVDWGDLDYLIIDLPPGTGDVQLSLAQYVPLTGAVVVTTPQDVAFADVRRAIKMFEMTHTRVLGLVENMSHFECGNCNTKHYIYGESRIDAHAAAHGLEVLGSLPLDSVTAIAADNGEPISIAAPNSQPGKSYAALAGKVAQKIAILTHGTDATPMGEKFKSFFKMKPA